MAIRPAIVCTLSLLLAVSPLTWGKEQLRLSAPSKGKYDTAATAPTQQAPKLSAPMLQGGVEHSEQMPPIQSRMGVGATFDELQVEKPLPSRIWYRVPLWMAGNWRYEEEHIHSDKDYKTGIVHPGGNVERRLVNESWGCQRDRAGGIWDFISVPVTTEVNADKEVWKDLHTNDSVLRDTETDVVMRWVFTRRIVSKTTKKIGKIDQVEQLTAFRPYGPDQMICLYSVKFFNQQGQPNDLLKTWRVGRRTAAYHSVNTDLQGNDTRASFREFLVSHGMQDLVPLDY